MENGNIPATQQDIERILQAIRDNGIKVSQQLEGLETKFSQQIESLETEFARRIEAVETKLLGAFFSYQEYDRIENRKFRADLSNISAASDLRFDNLESRISALEKKILTNPIQPPQQ